MNKTKQLLSICFSAILISNTITTAFAAVHNDIKNNWTENARNIIMAQASSEADGNTIILQKNAIQNQIINGNLTIPAFNNNEQIILEHITVTGTVFVQGGGTINIKGCNINNIQVQKQNVVIDSDISSNINTMQICTNSHIKGDSYKTVLVSQNTTSAITVDADIQLLEINTPSAITLLSNAQIQTLQVYSNAANTSIDFSQNAQVQNCVLYAKTKITGTAGKINELTAYVNDIETDIKPEQLFLKQNANKITYTARESITKSSSKTSSSNENLILDTDGQGFNATAKTYQSATIKAQNATLYNAIIEKDVIIQDVIKNTSATLKEVTVNGNVNIYGGRDAINIENCNIQNDVISYRKDRTPVTLFFDSNTNVSGNIAIRGNTILKGDRYTILKNVLVEQYTGRKLEIDTNIKNITFDTTAVEVQLNQNKTIQSLKVSDVPNTLKINMEEGSVIEELYADANIEITGAGTIQKLITNKQSNIASSITLGQHSDGFISVTGIENVPTNMYQGKSITLSGAVVPYNASKKAIRWSIKDAGNTGAAISNGNVLTAYAEGTVIVTAQIFHGIGNAKHFSQDFIINVEDEFKNFIKTEDIVMTSPTIWDIDEPLVLTGYVTPSNATHNFIQWSIKNDGNTKSKITNNELTAQRTGVVTVCATVEKGIDGISDITKEFHINIIPIEEKFVKVENIVLHTPTICKAGEMLQLSGTIQPNNANAKEIQWRIVNAGTTGAYIQNHTNLYTRTPGNIVISATVYGGSGNSYSKTYYQEFNITVK